MKQLLSFSLAAFACATGCSQQIETEILATSSKLPSYELEMVVPDIGSGWGMAFLPDGSLLVTDRGGDLIHFKEGERSNVSGVPPVVAKGQGGLLDIALHPNYEDNGWIYLSLSSPAGEGSGCHTSIVRGRLRNGSWVDQELVYKAVPNTGSGRHFGSRMAFDDDGLLFFSVGDRGDRDNLPQDLTRDGGKIYRLHDDGTIPEDNPFVGQAGAVEAAYSYGHRNPQGMTKHPLSGRIWTHEHGPRGGDEINIISKGLNYGWPVISYGINYNGTTFTDKTAQDGMEQPLFFWVPSIAPSGMTFVTSEKYPELHDSLLVGSLKFAYVERVILEDEKVIAREKLLENEGRVRDIRQAPDGFLYVSMEGRGVLRILPADRQ